METIFKQLNGTSFPGYARQYLLGPNPYQSKNDLESEQRTFHSNVTQIRSPLLSSFP